MDLWLPDSKYADNAAARRLSGLEHYVEHNCSALKEIYRLGEYSAALDAFDLAGPYHGWCQDITIDHDEA